MSVTVSVHVLFVACQELVSVVSVRTVVLSGFEELVLLRLDGKRVLLVEATGNNNIIYNS